MVKSVSLFNGYVCVPYLHSHDSIELKDKWANSRNIDSMFFVTATFSEDSKPYFKSVISHFILAKFKNPIKMQKDLSSYIKGEPIFVFNIDNVIFERDTPGKTNFISIYYLEYGESNDDLLDVAAYTARKDKICLLYTSDAADE